ncbi:MAG: tetratricopeptide repeat protein [Verrucomicrobia bacterium]|nr:tetratricopeptide repeat protein [Verrucomicrobiota bacterium]
MFKRGVMVVTGLLLALSCGAQEPDLGGFDHTDPDEVVRKRAGFWRRPDRKTAAEQLVYARSLADGGAVRKAAKQYRALVHEWHDTPEAVTAQMAYAELLEARGKYNQSFNEFQYLVEFYAGQFDYGEVLDRQFRIANEVMNQRHGGFLFLGGFKSPERALPLFKQVAENGPTWERGPEVQFFLGWIQEQDKQYDAAIRAYDMLRQRWPRSELAVTAGYGGTRCLVKLADATARDEVVCRRALVGLAGFIRDYPDDPNVAAATQERDRISSRLSGLYYERAAYYDKIARRPDSALIAYADFLRQFPYAEQAEAVSLRVRELEAMQAAPETAP